MLWENTKYLLHFRCIHFELLFFIFHFHDLSGVFKSGFEYLNSNFFHFNCSRSSQNNSWNTLLLCDVDTDNAFFFQKIPLNKAFLLLNLKIAVSIYLDENYSYIIKLLCIEFHCNLFRLTTNKFSMNCTPFI